VRGGAILTLATEATSVLSHGNPAWDRWGDGPRIPAMRGARPASTLAPPLVSRWGGS
jgi:hypothetical protein